MESTEVLLGRLDEKLDGLITKVGEADARVALILQDHEQRLRKVEGWRSHVIGLAAGVGLIIGFLKDAITGLFKA